MNLYKQVLFIFVLCLLQSGLFAQIQFLELSYEEALETAAKKKKSLFLDFRADWCKPCVEMEKNTFSNKEVGKYINDNFIPIKIDVDYTKGKQLKSKFFINALPTILIVNSSETVLNRIIGLQTPETLLFGLGYSPSPTKTDDQNTELIENDEVHSDFFLKRWWRKLFRS